MSASINGQSFRILAFAGMLTIARIDPVDTVARAQPIIVNEGIVNAASYRPGPIAPGQILSIFGRNLGPDDRIVTIQVADGRVTTELAGTRVLFDGIQAPLLFVTALQTSCIVPYGVAGKAAVNVVVERNGIGSQPIATPVVSAAPGVFTLDASGRGQGAILNQDLTLNSPSNPASQGEIVVIYGTGEGQIEPPKRDGEITGNELSRPRLPVRVEVEGVPAEVLYAGTAPGLVAGVLQVNARLPFGLFPAFNNIEILVGDAPSQRSVDVEVEVPPSTCPATDIGYNSDIQGEITPLDCKQSSRGPEYYTDVYTFQGTAGDRVRLTYCGGTPIFAGPKSDRTSSGATLYAPGGTTSFSFLGGCRATVTNILPASGPWRIEVSAGEPHSTVSYEFSLLRILMP